MEIPTTAIVFKNVRFVGIMLAREVEEGQYKKLREMFQYLSDLIISGKLKPVPADLHSFLNFKTAILNTINPTKNKSRKQIILLQDDDFYLKNSKI